MQKQKKNKFYLSEPNRIFNFKFMPKEEQFEMPATFVGYKRVR